MILASCPLCAYSYSAEFIHHQTSTWHRHALAKGISFRISAPPPQLQQAPQDPTVGSGDSWGSPLPPAAASQAATQMLQPSSSPAALSVGKMVCARRREAGGNLSNPFCAPSSRSRVPDGKGWIVVYTSLASCLPMQFVKYQEMCQFHFQTCIIYWEKSSAEAFYDVLGRGL